MKIQLMNSNFHLLHLLHRPSPIGSSQNFYFACANNILASFSLFYCIHSVLTQTGQLLMRDRPSNACAVCRCRCRCLGGDRERLETLYIAVYFARESSTATGLTAYTLSCYQIYSVDCCCVKREFRINSAHAPNP